MEHDFIDKTILVVEDEEDSRYLFEKTLKKTRADVLYVNNGVAAVNMIKCKPNIDMVLMDIRLPLMDGISATSAIKKLSPEVPIIIQTAYEMIYAKDEAIKSGCDDFISKPIHSGTLLSLIKKHLRS
jgi:CheY-like chemotaxis protein